MKETREVDGTNGSGRRQTPKRALMVKVSWDRRLHQIRLHRHQHQATISPSHPPDPVRRHA